MLFIGTPTITACTCRTHSEECCYGVAKVFGRMFSDPGHTKVPLGKVSAIGEVTLMFLLMATLASNSTRHQTQPATHFQLAVATAHAQRLVKPTLLHSYFGYSNLFIVIIAQVKSKDIIDLS